MDGIGKNGETPQYTQDELRRRDAFMMAIYAMKTGDDTAALTRDAIAIAEFVKFGAAPADPPASG